MQSVCAYQERSHSEIRTRLIEHSVYGDDLEQIIAELITEDFLNEERFAKAYARGKFRIKNWGKGKILKELKFRRISEYSMRKAMEEIEYEDYLETLTKLLNKKNAVLREKNKWKRRKKLIDFAIQKGYEWAAIYKVLPDLDENKE